MTALALSKNEKGDNMNAPLLSLKGVTKIFGGLRAVNDLSFDVCQGELLAVIGPNGAGKTTLFNLITKVYPLSGGEIWFKGKRLDILPAYTICSLGIARTFQDLQLFTNMSVIDNVMVGCQRWTKASLLEDMFRFGRTKSEEPKILEYAVEQLSRVGLAEKTSAMPASLPLRGRKVLGIARALASQPELLLLDEPAGGLNFEEIGELGKFITTLVKEYGMTVVMVEHRMEIVMGVCDRVVVMNFGSKIAEGTPAEIQKNEEVISAYLGGEFKV